MIYFGVVPTGTLIPTIWEMPGSMTIASMRFVVMSGATNYYAPKRALAMTAKVNSPGANTLSTTLASHFDLTGTSNRPVTIQLPGFLPALEAQMASDPSNRA